MKFKDGIFDYIDINEYHADREYVSSSSLKEANKSLAHHRYYLDKENERKGHFDFGNVFELALMDAMNDTNEFEKKVAVFDEAERPQPEMTFGSKENKEWKERFYQTDKYIIAKTGKESVETMQEMLESCWKDKIIQRLLKNTDYQKTLFWTDPETDIKVKTRPDVCKRKRNIIMDIKTTLDASPKSFAKDAANFDYPLQAVIQMEGAIQTGLMPKVDLYYWIAVEKTAPYNAQVYQFLADDWGWNHNRYTNILHQIKVARENETWLGYSAQALNEYGILDLELPLWFRG